LLLFPADQEKNMSQEALSEGRPRGHGSSARTTERPLRTAIVPVRLAESERDQLAEVAREMGLSLSTYVRQVVLARPLPPRRALRPIPEINREVYLVLGRVAANLNQIARRMNERGGGASNADVLKVLRLLAELVGTVRVEVIGTTFEEGKE
jgi:hypothetical protein